MKSNYILSDYERFWSRGETEKGHYKDIYRAKIMTAIMDLAEDMKKLESRIKFLDRENSL